MFKVRSSRPVASSREQGYISSDVSRICGVSLRQLQWWDERKIVSARQDRHKRVYMTEEVVEISLIAELRRKGWLFGGGKLFRNFDERKQTLDCGLSLAGFQVIINGRFWVITEG